MGLGLASVSSEGLPRDGLAHVRKLGPDPEPGPVHGWITLSIYIYIYMGLIVSPKLCFALLSLSRYKYIHVYRYGQRRMVLLAGGCAWLAYTNAILGYSILSRDRETETQRDGEPERYIDT